MADAVEIETMKNYNIAFERIDPSISRYPYCIVWTPIPVLSWLFPFIGHMGICTSTGVIRDFAGPYFVSSSQSGQLYLSEWRIQPLVQKNPDELLKQKQSYHGTGAPQQFSSGLDNILETHLCQTGAKVKCEDNMAFGRPTKYWMLDVSKVYASGSNAWDTAVHNASEEYKQRMHNLCCDNCHSHVAMALNLMHYDNSTSWNMVNLCLLSLIHGKHVSCVGFLKTWLPFCILTIVIVAVTLSLNLR
ncbi:transmembrane protein 222 isoform X1 [Carassius auratus]|uniref:Transmembrane protein 222 isoform X1 n=1 Tax=Carassius auratus TaxID=7957 RepID=A0A6P6RFF3_CARAU|nr:transmembrane protein 222-like isoform X1 [Carassius auratus]